MLKSALARMSRAVSSAVLLSGQAHHQSGDVLTFRLSDGLLRARVKGKAHQIYDVYMDLKAFPSTPSRCRCEEKHNCEHAVAALFALNARETEHASQNSNSVSSQSFQQTVIEAESVKWYSESRGQGRDFFAYELGILINNKRVSIVPLVASLLLQFDARTIETMLILSFFACPLVKINY